MNGISGKKLKSNAAYVFASKARLKLGHLFVLAVLLFAPAPDTPFILLAGAFLVAYGELMRIAAAGQIRKNEELAASGPYAFTRNPLYFGSLAMGAGVTVLSQHWAFYAAFAALFFPLYYITITGEEVYLKAKFGSAYEDFICSTPRLVPSPVGLFPHVWFRNFNGEKMKDNRETATALTMAAVVMLFIIKWKYHLELAIW